MRAVPLIIISMLAISCSHQWIRNTRLNGIEFDKIRYSCNKSDTIAIIGYLRNDTMIQGYPCKKGWIHFTKDMEIKLLCLSKTYDLGETKLPPKSWIINAHHDDYITVVFPKDTLIQGYPVRGGGGVTGIRTRFDKTGVLKSFFPSTSFTQNSTTYKKSLINAVQVLPDGNLMQK